MKLKLLFTVVVVVITGACFHVKRDAGGYNSAAALINKTIRANHYHPDELDNDAYRQIEKNVLALGETAASADEFMTGFNAIWQNGPFSHVGLRRAEEPAADRYARLDTLKARDGAVTLAWEGSAAILTVNTMTGTVEAIDAAYDEIAARGAQKLIIDLRSNTGGGFGVVPLVGHLISEPVDAGVFVSGLWYHNHDEPPRPADFSSATPWRWRGYSVRAFIADMLSRPLTSYRIEPMQPRFQGPVFVLTSARSISAAEIAADALKSIDRATIIGEKTPGILLSSQLFDIPGGFHLRVPIADYYSIKNGRIEGVGVTPAIAVKAEQALDAALRR